jgi:uncharacterized protein (UPF0332 family)
MEEREPIYLVKAVESLEGAASKYLGRRYNNCANRSYYASFQAAIAALQRAGIAARGGEWGHDFVPAQFEGQLIYRRAVYPAALRGALGRLYSLRAIADYTESAVSRTEADRALRRARFFVTTIQEGGIS